MRPKLIFRHHAIKRMFERSIAVDDVGHIIENGKNIQEYPDDKPFASRLILGWSKQRPLHVVCADDKENQAIVVITVYEPRSYGFLQAVTPIFWGSKGLLEVQTAKAMRSSLRAMMTMASVVAKPFSRNAI